LDEEGNKRDKLLKWNSVVNPFQDNTIYVPKFIGSRHWCLTVIEINQRNIYFHDSLVYDGAAKLWYQHFLE
jgi:Ulp1 family protease